MRSRVAFVVVAVLVLLAAGCHQKQAYQGVQLSVLGVQRVGELRSSGPITAVRTGEGFEFAVVRLEITWPAAQQELPLDRTQVQLSDAQGEKYEPAVWALAPLSSGGKSTTVEEIPFRVPRGRQLKTFCVGQTCFNL